MFPIMDPLERALRRKVHPDQEVKLFCDGHCANPEATLKEIGERLAEIIRKQNESREALGELWRRYLLDCKKHGVEPHARPV